MGEFPIGNSCCLAHGFNVAFTYYYAKPYLLSTLIIGFFAHHPPITGSTSAHCRDVSDRISVILLPPESGALFARYT